MKMENNLNENFILTEEQIIFIDDGFINKQKNIKDVIEELVKQDDNNFKKKDIEQIIELYMEIKRQGVKQCSKDRWTKEELKTLDKEIKNKGSITNITAFSRELKEKGLFKSRSYQAIYKKIFDLKSQSPEKYPEIEIQNKEDWTQEELEILDKEIKTEIEKRGSITNLDAFSRKLKRKGLFKSRSYQAIYLKIYDLKNKSPEKYQEIKIKHKEDLTQEKPKILNDEINKNLTQRLGESLDKYIKNTEQTGEEEREQQFLNNLHDAGLEFRIEYISLSFKSSDTSDKEPISQHPYSSLPSDMLDLPFNEPSSNEHSI